MSEVQVAIAWYSPVEYVRFKEASDDPEVWSEEYVTWEANLAAKTLELEADGLVVTTVKLHLEEFQSWCYQNHEKNDAEARSRYAAFLCRQNSEVEGGDE